MQLEEFFDYKNRFVEDIVTNKEIVKLLAEDGGGVADPVELVYSQVFPYEYVPETIQKAQTFICCDVDVQKSINKTKLIPVMYVWVFTHKSKMRLPEGGIRVDRICSEIAKAINGSRYYGLGELDLHAVRRFAPVTGYQGKIMTFMAEDFNRLSPSGKPVPSNRKTG